MKHGDEGGLGMEIQLRLHASDLPAEALQERTRKLGRLLNQESGVQARIAEGGAPSVGSKGDPVALGTLVLAFVASGALKATLEILKSFLEQRGGTTRKAELTSAKGGAVIVTLADLAPEKFEATVQRLQAVTKTTA